MVLSFALCATFAFAQTNRTLDRAKLGDNAKMAPQGVKASALNNASVSYKGSIFAKDDTLALFDFSMPVTDASADYSFGTLTASDVINGRAEVAHTQPYAGSTWHRWYGIDSTQLQNPGVQDVNTVYPAYGFIYGGYHIGAASNYIHSAGYRLDTGYCSSLNGWVMLDVWGGAEAGSGPINAYIAFDPVPTTDAQMISIRFFEFYYHFYDSTFVDYSVDNGTTWNSIRIHTNVSVNDDSWGYVRFSLPAAAAAGDNVMLRIRFKSDYSRAYGYYWMLDDVAVTKNRPNVMSTFDQAWLAGAYPQLPQGMELPVEWASQVINAGYVDQTNTAFTLNHVYGGTASAVDTYNVGTVQSEVDSVFDFVSTASFPTQSLGDNFITMTLSTDSIIVPYDTILYVVNDIEDGSYTWARDNGILNPGHAFLYGFDTSTYENEGETYHYVTEETPYYTNQGHSVYTLYETGSTIPVDDNQEPWVIRGIEYVVAVDEDIVNSSLPAIIAPTIVRDSHYTENGNSYVRFLTVPTGVTSYTTDPANEYNDPVEMRDFGFYQSTDGYNTVRIDFAVQTPLMPNQQYHVGYELMEDARFAVAHTAFNTYAQWDEENQRYTYSAFRNNPLYKKYANNFTYNSSRLAKGSDALVYTPGMNFTWAGYNVGYFPMIRLLVGPRSVTNNIAVNCSFEDDDDELGGVYSAEVTGLCGDTLSVVQGSSTHIFIIPESDFSTFTLTVDGVEIDITTLETENFNTSGGATLIGYKYEFNNVNDDHVVDVFFEVGIDDVASRVKMNLQPNPASSNVKLNIEGVTGYVNCSLIDMSGRTVRSSRINAETENTINLNGLAKGAYFVRITNNDFTKVERLIVR